MPRVSHNSNARSGIRCSSPPGLFTPWRACGVSRYRRGMALNDEFAADLRQSEAPTGVIVNALRWDILNDWSGT
ncbi:hypothetical protein GCM10009540_42300 [Streptomyces turgidiscabies]